MSVLKSLALLLTLASAAATATASDFFVDGLRGTDWPDYGRSASQPWKTIQYAAQHLPVPMPTQSHTLFIAGGQTYGAATNGEAFPLPALYNIQYLGTGPRPIMDVPSGTVGMWFPGTVEFTGWTKVAHLEFRNGGLKLGAGNGVRFHRPVIDDCVFDRCGVLVETPLTQSVNAPVVQSCAFRGAGAGIFLHTREHGTDFSVDATVTDCVFEDIPGDAVRLRQSDPRGTTYLMVSLNECRFTRCFVGVELSMDVGTTGPTNRFGAQLRNCAFRLSSRAGSIGIAADLHPAGGTDLGVRNSTFQYGTTGIEVSSSFGSSRVAVADCLFRSVGTGVQFGASGALNVERAEFRNCRVGMQTSGLNQTVTNRRNRFLGNARGVVVHSDLGSRYALESVMVVGGLGTQSGVELDTDAVVEGSGLTVADCSGTGLLATKSGAGSKFINSIFANNGTEVAGSIAIEYSALQKQTWPGFGNIRVVPQLRRPFFKLLPSSRCIDAGRTGSGVPQFDYEGDPRIADGGTALRPDMGADEFIRGGSARAFAPSGWGRRGIVPTISSPGNARIGSNLRVQLHGAKTSDGGTPAGAALLLGLRDDEALDLFGLDTWGSLAWLRPAATVPAVPVHSDGSGAIGLPVPMDRRLVGESLSMQWMVLHPAPSLPGLVGSNGLRVTFGR